MSNSRLSYTKSAHWHLASWLVRGTGSSPSLMPFEDAVVEWLYSRNAEFRVSDYGDRQPLSVHRLGHTNVSANAGVGIPFAERIGRQSGARSITPKTADPRQ
jgi:hypothetical protein